MSTWYGTLAAYACATYHSRSESRMRTTPTDQTPPKYVTLASHYPIEDLRRLLGHAISPVGFGAYVSRNKLMGKLERDVLEVCVSTTKTTCMFQGTLRAQGTGTVISGTFHDAGDLAPATKWVFLLSMTIAGMFFALHVLLQPFRTADPTGWVAAEYLISAGGGVFIAGVMLSLFMATLAHGIDDRKRILDFLNEIVPIHMVSDEAP